MYTESNPEKLDRTRDSKSLCVTALFCEVYDLGALNLMLSNDSLCEPPDAWVLTSTVLFESKLKVLVDVESLEPMPFAAEPEVTRYETVT